MSLPKRKPVQPGDVIGGKYRVEQLLGEGGVGIVVRARHLELRLPVAIKVLLENEDRDQVVRFMREARASVRIQSEHVARVTDVGRLVDGRPYIVMEFLEGEDLGALSERGPMAVPEAAALLLQACEGIAAAHALGIVHRDVKPRNLFVTRSAHGALRVKVLDFGLARAFDAGSADARLTSTMMIAGSPPYMSPEQVRALRDVDARSDIWSLGVSFYELLTTRMPFESPTVTEVCARVLKDPPTPVDEFLPGVPDDVRRVLDRCLAKERADRFQNLTELAAALEPLAPPTSAGTAERIRGILAAPPPPEDPAFAALDASLAEESSADSETRTAFDRDRARISRRTPIAAVAGAALGAIAVALSAGLVHFHGDHSSAAPAKAATVEAADARRGPAAAAPDARSAAEPVSVSGASSATLEPLPAPSVRAANSEDGGAPRPDERPRDRAAGAPSGPRRTPKPAHAESTRM
jgi:serine/threonine-protein kinase